MMEGVDADQNQEMELIMVEDGELSDELFERMEKNAPPVSEVMKQVSLFAKQPQRMNNLYRFIRYPFNEYLHCFIQNTM